MHASPTRLARLAARLPGGRPIVDGPPPARPSAPVADVRPWVVLDDAGIEVDRFHGDSAHLLALREQDRRTAVTRQRHTIASA